MFFELFLGAGAQTPGLAALALLYTWCLLSTWNLHANMRVTTRRSPNLSTFNLDTLQTFLSTGRLDPTQRITPVELSRSGLVARPKDGIKLLGRGTASFTTPNVHLLVSRASASAIRRVEELGGSVVTRYYTRLSLRRLIRGEVENRDTPLPVGKEFVEGEVRRMRSGGWKYRLPDPTGRWEREYYRDVARRGYMSGEVAEGESPSLFWRVPPAVRGGRKGDAAVAEKVVEGEEVEQEVVVSKRRVVKEKEELLF